MTHRRASSSRTARCFSLRGSRLGKRAHTPCWKQLSLPEGSVWRSYWHSLLRPTLQSSGVTTVFLFFSVWETLPLVRMSKTSSKGTLGQSRHTLSSQEMKRWGSLASYLTLAAGPDELPHGHGHSPTAIFSLCFCHLTFKIQLSTCV